MTHLRTGLSLLALCLCLSPLSGQSGSCWSWMLPDTDFEKNDASTLGPGDVLWIGGTFSGTLDMNPDSTLTDSLTSAEFSDAFIASYDADGVYRFAFNLPGVQILDMATDAAGNLYVAGFHLGSSDVDPGPATVPLTAFGGTDACMLSYDEQGQYRWSYSYGDIGADEFRSIAVTAHQQVLIGGSYFGTVTYATPGNSVSLTAVGGTDAVIAQFSPAGELDWVRSFGGNGFDNQATIGIDGQGGDQNWLAFAFLDTVDMPVAGGSTAFPTKGIDDIMIARIDSSGDVQAAWSIGGVSRDVPKFITTDPANNLYLSGAFASTIDLDPSPANLDYTSLGGQDIFVARFNSGGALLGGIALGGTGTEETNMLGYEPYKEKIILTMEAEEDLSYPVDVDNDSSAEIESSGFTDSYLFQFDIALKNHLGVHQVGGPEAEVGLKVMFPSGNDPDTQRVVIVGRSSGTVDLSPPAPVVCNTNMIYSSLGVFDVFAASFPLAIPSPSTSVSSPLDLGISMYPNPVREILTLDFTDAPGPASPWRLFIHDMQGRQWKKSEVAGWDKAQVSVANLPVGVYQLTVLNAAEQRQTFVFMKTE